MTRIDPDTVAREIVEKWDNEYRKKPTTWEEDAAALQSAISSTITRYAEALDVAKNELCGLAVLGGLTPTVGVQAKEALHKIDSILSRSDIPEMEDVTLERWAVVRKDDLGVITIEPTEGTASSAAGNCFDVIKLTGTIQRPKAKPVVKSISGEVTWVRHASGIVYPSDLSVIAWAALVGRTGPMTFAYTEHAK